MKVWTMLTNPGEVRECVGVFSSLGRALTNIIDYDCEPIMSGFDHLSVTPLDDCLWANKGYEVVFHHKTKNGMEHDVYWIFEQEIDKDEYKD